jgi:hypothetical protein
LVSPPAALVVAAAGVDWPEASVPAARNLKLELKSTTFVVASCAT